MSNESNLGSWTVGDDADFGELGVKGGSGDSQAS